MANVNIFEMAQTWNNGATVFTAIEMDVTDTASDAASLLFNLLIGGVSKFKVSKTGVVTLPGTSTPAITFAGSSLNGMFNTGGNLFLQAAFGGGVILKAGSGAPVEVLECLQDGSLAIGPSGAKFNFFADAIDICAQRRGLNSQTFNCYFSFTSASDYTRFAVKTATGIHTLETESAGASGEANIDLALTPKGTGRIRFGTHTAIGAETVTGFITIKDSGGTSRKIAVVS